MKKKLKEPFFALRILFGDMNSGNQYVTLLFVFCVCIDNMGNGKRFITIGFPFFALLNANRNEHTQKTVYLRIFVSRSFARDMII